MGRSECWVVLLVLGVVLVLDKEEDYAMETRFKSKVSCGFRV